MSKAIPTIQHGNIASQKTILCIAIREKDIFAVIFGQKINDFPSTTNQTQHNNTNNMDKFLENQASNLAFQVAGEWNWSKRDQAAKQKLESEKQAVLRSYSNRPEFAEKFNAALAYYMVRENYIREANESAH